MAQPRRRRVTTTPAEPEGRALETTGTEPGFFDTIGKADAEKPTSEGSQPGDNASNDNARAGPSKQKEPSKQLAPVCGFFGYNRQSRSENAQARRATSDWRQRQRGPGERGALEQKNPKQLTPKGNGAYNGRAVRPWCRSMATKGESLTTPAGARGRSPRNKNPIAIKPMHIDITLRV